MSGCDADTCDVCGAVIAFGEMCYLVPTGESLDGLPIVGVKCAPCGTQP